MTGYKTARSELSDQERLEVVAALGDKSRGSDYYEELVVAQAALLLADIVFDYDANKVRVRCLLSGDGNPTLREVARVAYNQGYRLRLELESIK